MWTLSRIGGITEHSQVEQRHDYILIYVTLEKYDKTLEKDQIGDKEGNQGAISVNQWEMMKSRLRQKQ